MANAQIYQKTIDASVQDGVDKSLILDPNAFYQRKFDFGDDWTEIKIGMFLSYTNSITDNNLGFPSGSPDFNSGATTNDTFNWFGIIRETDPRVLPLDSGSIFAGIDYYLLHSISSATNFDTLNVLGGYGSSDSVSRFQTVHNTTRLQTATPSGRFFIPFTQIDDQTSFASYLGISFRITNKGEATQGIEFKSYRIHSNETWNQNDLTDISLLNLKNLINGQDVHVGTITERTFNDGSSALPLPDSLFFYNAFLDVRPRIHAIAVKKIS